MENGCRKYRIVYCTPALYMAGGVERVLTLKANYFAERYGYDVTIVLTEGKGKPLFYPLSEKVRVVNLDIGFEELWTCPLAKRIVVYLKKQRRFRRKLTEELMRSRPDITVSLLRREINFINGIKDGSLKIGELHINRANYRNFPDAGFNPVKRLLAWLWGRNLTGHLRGLSRLVVLTERDRMAWAELDNVTVIPNPLPFRPAAVSRLEERRVVAVGRYSHEKGFDLLLRAWAEVERCTMNNEQWTMNNERWTMNNERWTMNDERGGWRLEVFGDGDRSGYERLKEELGLRRCRLNGRTDDVQREYLGSSLFVSSSRFEGFGLALAEAMACGLPVVAFDCPWGPGEIVSDGEDGLLVENGDTDGLAEALLRLMADGELRRRMGTKAAENVGRFDMDVLAGRWRQLFEEVIRKEEREVFRKEG